MQNFQHRGDTLDIVAAAEIISGSPVVVGSIVGIAAVDAKIGETFALSVVGVYRLPKVSALAIAVGDKVYWDNTAKLVNKTASGNTLLGVATEAAANPSPDVAVRLNGSF
jgi:predicted RecA/RadA family phage recombinase